MVETASPCRTFLPGLVLGPLPVGRMLIEYTHHPSNCVTLHAGVEHSQRLPQARFIDMENLLQFFRRRPGYRTATLLTGSLFWLVGFFLLPLA